MSAGASRSFVVGDIHGCVEEVDRLIDQLALASDDTIVFLGDYIDRGPASKAVVDRLLRLRHEGPRSVFLKGNHEDMFLAFMGLHGHYGESFLYNGGDATLQSYGVHSCPAHEISRNLPPEHLEFLLHLEVRCAIEGFLCVHAGVNPNRPLDGQMEEDLLWIRGAFIQKPHSFPTTIIFGHTPWRDVHLDLPYKIGLDTGLVYGNKLSCLELSEKRLFQIRRGGTEVTSRSLLGHFEATPRD